MNKKIYDSWFQTILKFCHSILDSDFKVNIEDKTAAIIAVLENNDVHIKTWTKFCEDITQEKYETEIMRSYTTVEEYFNDKVNVNNGLTLWEFFDVLWECFNFENLKIN